MKHSSLFLVVLILVVGCEMAKETNPEGRLSPMESQLQAMLESPFIEPEGEMSHRIIYGGDSREVFETIDVIYPSIGDVKIYIRKDKIGDTTNISLNYYKNGLLQSSHHFPYNINRAEWSHSREYVYNSDGLLKELFNITPENSRYLSADYIYDLSNRLIKIFYPNGNDVFIYTYDEEGQIFSEWQSSEGVEEQIKYNYMEYEYVEGLLRAKKSGDRGSLEGPFKDRFQYFYDKSGKIIAINEFDVYFGYSQLARTEIFYH